MMVLVIVSMMVVVVMMVLVAVIMRLFRVKVKCKMIKHSVSKSKRLYKIKGHSEN